MTKFQKGHSGNPNGRPKETVEIRQAKKIARTLAERAMRRLEAWMDSDDPKASVAACNSIINRAEGMPKQEIEASGTGTLTPIVNVTIGAARTQSATA